MRTFAYIAALLAAAATAYFYFNPQEFHSLLYAVEEVIEGVAQNYIRK